ncbi:LOW QUALITY PROTEIN: Nonribosomal peptide synthetase [Phytophthora megakarya]|uniref:Nonribosomal peptide synthetase n=1 Tax=Phytophthora megakarya TaxID=4795 RepID=A0A225WDX1_9STRA|nr:LOW QUALITY PROTEIN: Nonribosomal peptide synthetase [Phytophthora megakarya]
MAGNLHGDTSTDDANEVVDLTSFTRALDAGQVDVAVHWLQLLLLSRTEDTQHKRRKTLQNSRVRRLKTLQSAVNQMLSDYETHKEDDGVTLRPGLAVRNSSCELSYPQLQMFALQRMQPCSTAYNVVRALQFNDIPLDLNTLEKTCYALMAKHEALRTCFDVDTSAGGQPRQIVDSVANFRGKSGIVKVVETELLAQYREQNSRTSELAAFVAKTAQEPFDLAQQAPIRVYVFTSPEHNPTSPWILAVVLHHIVTDAASSQIFWNDFHELYARFLHSDNATMSEIVQQFETEASGFDRLTYRDFAVWQRLRMRSGVMAPLLQYWTHQLNEGGVPPLLELPFDTERSNTFDGQDLTALYANTTEGDVVTFTSSSAVQKRFSELCHAQGASMFMGLLAVFYLLIERLSGQQDFVIGVPASGREAVELQDVLGYFVNTLPLRLGTKVTGNEDFTGFLALVREVVLGAYNHMEIPFHKVLEHLRASAQSNRDSEGDVERRWQHPLFQIMFAWEQSDDNSHTKKYDELVLPHHSAKFDLMLSMRYHYVDGDRVLEGSMEYPTAKFEQTTVKRFTTYYLTLLEQITNTPTALVHSPSISMLSDAERKLIITKWGAPDSSSSVSTNKGPSSSFLQEALYSQVLKTPQNPALYFEGTQWTYEELWRYSGHVVDALGTIDIRDCNAELHIGLLLDRGLENVAAMVGVLRLSAVFVPLDPEFPRERLCYMARDSNLQVIITQGKHAELASYLSASSAIDSEDEVHTSPRILRYEDVGRLSSSDQHHRKEIRVQHRDSRDAELASAYILYTSGSTGNPKGVVVPHAALMSTLWWTVRSYKVNSSDVFLQSTSTTLDGSLSQLFSPLIVGGSARITRPKGLHELHYMRNVLIESPHITFCVFVPSYFALLVDYLNDRGDTFPDSIKHVILAGEAFPIELAHQFYKKHKCELYIGGKGIACGYWHRPELTENTFILQDDLLANSNLIEKRGQRWYKTGDLVKWLPSGDLVFLGRTDAQVKHHGMRIELQEVRNVLLRHSSIKAAEVLSIPQQKSLGQKLRQTSSTLIASTIDQVVKTSYESIFANNRWYKTGDLVKWLPSGDLVFLGRTDAQVKHHGMRIELQEVRNVLLRHSSIKAAEVLSIPQQKSLGQKLRQTSSTLVAFVMLADSIDDRSSGEGYLDELREYLREHLPIHMVPQSIKVISIWPRTPNGKIDLRALARCVGTISSGSNSNAGELQPTDSNGSTITMQLATNILRQVWVQVLRLDHLEDDEGGNSDHCEQHLMSKSFFELGGDSLAAIRAIALAQARGLHLTLEHFFRTSSLPDMARSAAVSMVDLRAWTSETLVQLNWSTSKESALPTLFLFHDADGTVWNLLELARQLPFPVIGVQAGAVSDDKLSSSSKPSSVEEIAKVYWEMIRERQNKGPYALGGFSFGCRVAHEVARLAIQEGHTLLPLILLDGLPFELAFDQKHVTKAEKEATRFQIEQYATEAFSDPLLQPLGMNYRKFCAMEEMYQPYTSTEMETCLPNPKPIWLRADLYMTQHWHTDLTHYRSLGIDITTVTTTPNCTHLTMLRHPTVEVLARHIKQRYKRR